MSVQTSVTSCTRTGASAGVSAARRTRTNAGAGVLADESIGGEED